MLETPLRISLGDYAQMAEFAGFPEIGALSLLYYRSGGILNSSIPLQLARGTLRCDETLNQPIDVLRANQFEHISCGCGHTLCGASSCHLPMPPKNPIMKALLRSLEKISSIAEADTSHSDDSGGQQHTAAHILQLLSNQAKSSSKGKKKGKKKPELPATPQRHQTLLPTVPNLFCDDSLWNIRFWEDVGLTSDSGDEYPSACIGSDDNSEHGPKKTKGPQTSDSFVQSRDQLQLGGRLLSPLLKILLLKLLYVNPIGGPFLQLACEAVAHISFSMPSNSDIGRSMAQYYKSHWAYYILVKALVLGERVKLHRRGTLVPYHTPIWDTVRGFDQRKFETPDEVPYDNVNKYHSLYDQILEVLDTCNSSQGDSAHFRQRKKLPNVHTSYPPIFVLGDSHVLSIAWQTICIPGRRSGTGPSLRTAVPFPATGIKAWHARQGTRFFTHYNLQTCLRRLPASTRTILLSAGEIDCREGIGGRLLEGYYNSCDDAVRSTVSEYIRAVNSLAECYSLQILLLPVAPHTYRSEKNGKSAGRALRRERTELWNQALREECAAVVRSTGDAIFGVYLLDFEQELRSRDESSPVGYVLNKFYNADFTHMNSAFLPLLEKSLERCGCNLNLI